MYLEFLPERVREPVMHSARLSGNGMTFYVDVIENTSIRVIWTYYRNTMIDRHLSQKTESRGLIDECEEITSRLTRTGKLV